MSYYSVGKFIKLRTDTSSIYTPQFSFSRRHNIPDTNAFKRFKKNSCLATLHDFKSIHETLQSNQNIETKQCYFTNNGLTIDQLEEHCKAISGDKWIVLKWWNTCDALDDRIDDKLLNKFGKEVKELVESDDDDDDVIQVNKEEEMLELMKKNWKKGVKDIMDRVIVRQKEKTENAEQGVSQHRWDIWIYNHTTSAEKHIIFAQHLLLTTLNRRMNLDHNSRRRNMNQN
eukprot:481487_1